MSTPSNRDLVRSLYESGMAAEVVDRIVAEDLVFDITPGFPLSGVYHGWPDVVQNFFGRLAASASLQAVPESFHADGDHVLVVGHYEARTPQGRSAQVRFIHDWTVTADKLAHLLQAADSHVLQQLIA